MSENTIIVRLRNQQEVVAHSDPKGFQFQRVSGYIGVSDFIQLFEKALNGVNPRNATRNRVVKDILETLEYSPELFWIMSKGIMVSTFYCKNWNVIVIGSHSKTKLSRALWMEGTQPLPSRITLCPKFTVKRSANQSRNGLSANLSGMIILMKLQKLLTAIKLLIFDSYRNYCTAQQIYGRRG